MRQDRLLLARLDESMGSIARLLGISRTTLYKHVPELRHDGGRAVLVDAVRSGALASYDARQLPVQTGIALRPEAHHG
ncbi:helix-turn-helix domain-containing protein [Pseudonocardia sp. KRD291]|uniref:helix-turn-helix domain-containing protein n=1 Tax=Pseudonocardia sp. KRD291 TaxID=2792007 RepID=UPI0027E35863|nr:helix-turn-helix domain-containing protein [Pseudonocardia sp. KRD291]